MAEVITVTALNRYVKALLDGSDLPTLSATPKAATAISPCGTVSAASRR